MKYIKVTNIKLNMNLIEKYIIILLEEILEVMICFIYFCFP